MAIIYISPQMGAGGPEIGMALAQRLGYRYVDQELLLDAARRYGLAEEKLSHLDESKPTLFERFDTETRHPSPSCRPRASSSPRTTTAC